MTQIIRVFPVQTNFTPTDNFSFIGSPSLFRPKDQLPVKISVSFTWDIPIAEQLKKEWSKYYNDVQIGGPAYNDPGNEFIPGLFMKSGVTITSRGCDKKCSWCFVNSREGQIRELQIKNGWIINDNNLLQCSEIHIKKVFDMLRRQPKPIEFKGGIDKLYLKDWHIPLFNSIRLKEIWLACDNSAAIPLLIKASKILEEIPIKKKRCYALIGYDNETLLEAESRLETIFNLGFLPFSVLYQPVKKREYNQEWKTLARKWSRPACFKTYMKSINNQI